MCWVVQWVERCEDGLRVEVIRDHEQVEGERVNNKQWVAVIREGFETT